MKHCPKDLDILTSNELHNYRYFSCGRCGGYWIPGSAITAALSARGQSTLGAMPIAEGAASGCSCPDCRSDCVSIFIAPCTLDVCQRCHGVWFDAGEVERMKELFPPGSAIVDAASSEIPRPPGSASFILLDIVLEVIFTIISS